MSVYPDCDRVLPCEHFEAAANGTAIANVNVGDCDEKKAM
jgi:hypothetical protein